MSSTHTVTLTLWVHANDPDVDEDELHDNIVTTLTHLDLDDEMGAITNVQDVTVERDHE